MLTYIFLSSLSFDDHAFWALSEITSIGPEIITFLGGFIHNFISHLDITFLGGLRPGSRHTFIHAHLSWRKRFYRDTTVQQIDTSVIDSCMAGIGGTEIIKLSFI